MNEYVIPLETVRQTDVARVGAKAAVLGALVEAGFPVPPGLCVTTAAFRLALGPWLDQIHAIIHHHDVHGPAGAVAAAEIIDELLVDLEVPAPVMVALYQALPAVADPKTLLAVRSSATAEDSAKASFAGQYRSVIGVRPTGGGNALQAAIVAVWRSFFSSHALAARAAHNSLDRNEAMAVLILPVVDAECAGVCLSVDPVHRRRDRIVITAAWGLGAGVVDGSVAADTAWVRRDGFAEGFEIEEQRVVEQAEQIALDPEGGLKQMPVPDERRRAACLPESWLQRVAQFCVAAEVLLGCPQDMEWAIAGGQVWVLQSRPITALPSELAQPYDFPVTWEDEQERRLAWIHYPYWRYVLKPLEMDYAYDREAAQTESGHYAGDERSWRVKIVNGRAYACWAPTDLTDGDRRIRRAARADVATRLQSQDITAWEYWGPEVIKATERLSAFDASGADGPQLAEHLENARAASRRHWVVHGLLWSARRQSLYAAYAAVSGLTESAAKEKVDKLLEGEETSFTRLIDGLYTLACTARKVPAVAALVADPPPDVLDRLATLPEAATFQAQLEDFMASFGDRSGVGYGSDVTICEPTWREDPALALRFAAPYLDPTVEPPTIARARAQVEREALIDQVCNACDDQEAVVELRRQLACARRQAVVMEEHNHYIDQMANGQLRQAILAAARWLVAHGTLTTSDEVFWLHYDEILSALCADTPRVDAPRYFADVAGYADVISARQAQHAEWEKLEPPPLLGTPEAQLPERPLLQDEVTPVALQGDDWIIGLGASPGRHRGRARVVPTSVLLPDLSPGEVLVAENVGPRWTPLLPILGGLVLDGGALGQHHAITAREYGVPAVIGTGNATRRIPDGAWVTVDGTVGTVEMDIEMDITYAKK
jgi:phosphohistidine swiveling domain-containing protein